TVTASITGVDAPAESVSILGAVPESGQHEGETWAYGFTGAPPATGTDGNRLPYTAEGKPPGAPRAGQLVLLRYSKRSGWQIADVLRCPPGESQTTTLCNSDGAFNLLPANALSKQSPVSITGGMTPSGEAWLWLVETATDGERRMGLFHRQPGGAFQFD